MVPPDRSTPRRKPPRPLSYCFQAQPTTKAARTTGNRQRTILLVYDFMVGLHAFPGTRLFAGQVFNLTGQVENLTYAAPSFGALAASSLVRLRAMLLLSIRRRTLSATRTVISSLSSLM